MVLCPCFAGFHREAGSESSFPRECIIVTTECKMDTENGFERVEKVLNVMTATTDPDRRSLAGMDVYELWDGDSCARLVLAEAMMVSGFEGNPHPADLLIDVCWLSQSEYAQAWICYILDGTGEDGACAGRAEAVPCRGTHPVSERMFHSPEWLVLMRLTQTERGYTDLPFNRNLDGGYENGTFLIRPQAWMPSFREVDTDAQAILESRPRFLFKPTGLELCSCDIDRRERWFSNHSVTEGELRKVLRVCVESVMDDLRGEAL